MHRNKSVNVHQFAMVPKADIPRSSFRMQKTTKTSFDAGYLVPIFCEEVLPGDTFNLRMTAFARLATPIFPFMDNLYFESFFFFVPNRLVWGNWVKFMGEQENPGDSISFTIPVCTIAGGWTTRSIGDYFGLPITGQINSGGSNVTHSCLPLRGYNLIYNKWFRDENLVSSAPLSTGDGPDSSGLFTLLRRGKRHDYFTGCLPFVQKGASVVVPLGTAAPVYGTGSQMLFSNGAAVGGMRVTTGLTLPISFQTAAGGGGGAQSTNYATAAQTVAFGGPDSGLFADLTAATASTINQLRQSFQIQKLLERDARGGTRYTEIVRSHFGVISPDARLQRPEYLGGGSERINVNPIAQTSETSTTPLGTLSAFGTGLAHGHGFTQSFTEHGYVIGLVNVRADLTYQQGLRRHWSRSTRYDFYFPVFAMLGEQAVLNQEIYCKGSAAGAQDTTVFGYQERWAEYRYMPSEITSLMRSNCAAPIDAWHLAQNFLTLPTLAATFIGENPPLSRVLAVGTDAGGQQLLLDAFFDIKAARPLPLYSVPGLVDHF